MSEFPTDEQFAAETKRRAAAAKAKTDEAKAAANQDKPDQYHPVKTGESFDSIAEALGHKDEGQDLMDHKHGGGITNGELAARHANLVSGADGKAVDNRGALLPVLTVDGFTTKTKLVEGQALLLPRGWESK